MLTTIREKTQGIIATFILLLVVIPFALWGVNSYFDSGATLNVAKAGGIDISQTAYRSAVDRLRGRVEPKTLESPAFKQAILDNLIDQALLAEDARKQGYRVSDAWLAETIRNFPVFKREGQFDTTVYEATLRRDGMSPQEFEKRLRDEALTGQIQAGLSESGIMTAADLDGNIRLMTQERELAYAVIDAEALIPKISVSGQEIEQYYSTHTEMFQIPEQVRVAYLRLSAADMNKGYEPTEEELKRAYADDAARYVTPERRRASHILISLPAQATEAQAREALAKIQGIARQANAGSDFAGLAKKYSSDSATAAAGGDLGEVRRGALPKELEAPIYALKKSGEIGQPVRSTYGYHLIKLTSLTAEKRKPFAVARQELAESVRKHKGEEKFLDQIEKFRNLVYEQPDSLAPAAQALGLEIQKSEWFTRTGGPGIAANPKIVEAAFEPDVLNQVRNSDAFEISADAMAAVRVIDRRPPGRTPLAEVRAQVERSLKQEQALKQANQLGEEWLRELRAGNSLQTLASKRGFKFQSPKLVTRQQSAGTAARIVEAAFRAPRPQGDKPVYDLINLGAQGYAVLALTRVREPSGKADGGLREQARSQLLARRGSDYYLNYRAMLREKAKIKIYSDQL